MLIVSLAVGLVLSVPCLVFVTECLIGMVAKSRDITSDIVPPFVVLIPAHNEARGIGATIDAAREELRACDRLLVVADNCTDDTAVVALAHGAEVFERVDRENLGKGFALAAGRSVLACDPPSVVLVLDADCLPDTGALQLLAAAANNGSVVQGLYLMAGGDKGGAKTGISSFAFLIKNQVRQRALQALGAPVLLQGTGMAFPWPVFETAQLASGNIVEDLELGLELALDGVPIVFQESAKFLSQASSGTALASQRVRWEHGSLGVARRYVPKLALAVVRLRFRLLPLLLDLLVPPLALLVLAIVAVAGAAVVFGALGSGFGLALWMMGLLGILATVIIATWCKFGRAVLPFAELLRVPAYMIWKMPIYARLFGQRERRWIRTERE